MKTAILPCLFSILLGAEFASAQLPPATLAKVTFEQKLNAQVPLDLPFFDESGARITLGDYFGHKPVILVLGYYQCPMLCTLINDGLIECLQDLKWSVSDQFDVINVSIDPTETPMLATEKKQTYLNRYGRSNAGGGWHFLTGKKSSIERLANEVGFTYAYDASIRQYAHPSGIVILTPQGKVAAYFFGINYPAKEVSTALLMASSNKIGSPVERLLFLCFHYSPITGKYGRLIMNTLRLCGAATLLALAVFVLVSLLRERRAKTG